MSKLLRSLAAGYGAKKHEGGCFSTILIFLILWWLLGYFGIFRSDGAERVAPNATVSAEPPTAYRVAGSAGAARARTLPGVQGATHEAGVRLSSSLTGRRIGAIRILVY